MMVEKIITNRQSDKKAFIIIVFSFFLSFLLSLLFILYLHNQEMIFWRNLTALVIEHGEEARPYLEVISQEQTMNNFIARCLAGITAINGLLCGNLFLTIYRSKKIILDNFKGGVIK